MVAIKLKKLPPYEFILEELAELLTNIKPMFGAYGLYSDNKIILILRKKEKFDNDTGIWVAIPDEHVASLKKEIRELKDLELFGSSPTSWQVLRENLSNFEELAFYICNLIKQKDHRIGRIPKSKPLKTKKAKK